MTVYRPRAFLDVSIDAEPAGRLVVELFADHAPKTCQNFLALCNGSLEDLTYVNSPFHRVIDEFMIQGGDITKGDGTGGTSIYGGDFADENLDWREMDAEGLLCMANRGRDTNSSQFFITLEPCPHLNGKHTIFGRLVSGQDVLARIAAVPVDVNDRPKTPVLIARCGELERKKKSLAVPQTEKATQPPETSAAEHSPGRWPRRDTHGSSGQSRSRSRSRKRRRSHSRDRRRQKSGSTERSSRSLSRDNGRRRDRRPHSLSRSRSRSRIIRRERSVSDDRQGRDPTQYVSRRQKHGHRQDQRADDHQRRQQRHYRDRDDDYRQDRDRGEAGRGRYRASGLRDQGRLGQGDVRSDARGDARLSRDEVAADEQGADGGIRFKGRGSMKFREPGAMDRNTGGDYRGSYRRGQHDRSYRQR